MRGVTFALLAIVFLLSDRESFYPEDRYIAGAIAFVAFIMGVFGL
jgi:hypothetical protein